jgi:hypothetical protein
LPAGDLVDLIQKNDAGLLHFSRASADHGIHVHQVLGLLGGQVFMASGTLIFPPAGGFGHEVAEHVLES